MQGIQERIFGIDERGFEELALEVFHIQYDKVEIYQAYCNSLRRTPSEVNKLAEIPFLPVEFFKTYSVIAKGQIPAVIFESSGTTGNTPSRHYVADTALYERSFLLAFEKFYGHVNDYVILALLPSYLERGNSSLVHMTDKLIRLSERPQSGFFLNEFDRLKEVLTLLKEEGKKAILLGVTYALLDFAETHALNFPELIVMETGGMKGRRKELTRPEVHQLLKAAFGAASVHSEYGMTELLSQGYSKGGGVFYTPNWMKVLVRDIYDPLSLVVNGKTGAVNIIDLANLNSCSFIGTSDLARVHNDGGFEILGRMENTEVRGCNLMVAENEVG